MRWQSVFSRIKAASELNRSAKSKATKSGQCFIIPFGNLLAIRRFQHLTGASHQNFTELLMSPSCLELFL